MTPLWLKLIPLAFRANIDNRPHLHQAISNTFWLFGGQALRMGVSLVVGVFIARYLGPERFGLLNYAIAFVALFGAVASLGLSSIVVRNLIKEPENAYATMGTAFFLQIVGGFVALGFVLASIGLMRSDDNLVKTMVVLLSLVMVLKSTEVVKYWFESQVQSKYAVWVENGVYLGFAALKAGLILFRAPLIAFVWTLLFEAVAIAIGLLAIYSWRGGLLRKWRLCPDLAFRLLSHSWPILISSTFVLVNLSIDKVLLKHLSDMSELGLYAAANALVAAWFFVPVAIGGSIIPRLTKYHIDDKSTYNKLCNQAYRLFGLGSAAIALPIYLFSEKIIGFIYGATYSGASEVLSLNIWAIIFISLVSLRGRLLVIEGKQISTTWLVFMGMASNILFNLLLVPHYGAAGAAFSFSVSWGLSAFLFPLLSRTTRQHGLMALGMAMRRQDA